MGRDALDWSGNIVVPRCFKYCPCCGVDRAEMFGIGHCAGCDYGSGRDWAGAKERRKKWADTR